MQFLILIASATFFTTGGVLMKMSEGLTRLWPTLGLFMAVCLGGAFQALSMRKADLSVAYILVLGIEAIFMALIGMKFFGEAMPPFKIAGIVLVVAGIIALNHA